jgi:hypothetical protein
MPGHLVGVDPVADVIVVLRTGQDGKASRQVDLLTYAEAEFLERKIRQARMALLVGTMGSVPEIRKTPEPEQTPLFDIDESETA